MNPIHLTFYLLRIPKLFLSLVFFPLLLSIVFVYFQLIITTAAYHVLTRNAETVKENFQSREENNFVRKIIYGDGKRLADAKVCKWIETQDQNGITIEVPPNAECNPSRLDVAIQSTDLSEKELQAYKNIFNGNVEKIHICKECSPDIIVKEEAGYPSTEIRSIWAAMIVGVVNFTSGFQEHYLEAVKSKDDVSAHLGNCSLALRGFGGVIKITGMESDIMVVLNFSFLIVVALWLALRAHRRVLDYFSRSGALLPLVAATGKKSFYIALWLLTIIRVAAFLLAALPLTVFSLNETFKDQDAFQVLYQDPTRSALWFVAIIFGLALATLVASLAELKHRHNLLSFFYRYIPLLMCGLGALVWIFSLLFEGSAPGIIRTTLTALPVIGMAPILIAPIMKPQIIALFIHSILTAGIFLLLLRHNTRWFAAHLEDL